MSDTTRKRGPTSHDCKKLQGCCSAQPRLISEARLERLATTPARYPHALPANPPAQGVGTLTLFHGASIAEG